MRYFENIFAPKLAALFVTPIVSATVEQIDSTLANQGVGKTIQESLKELPWNQQKTVKYL